MAYWRDWHEQKVYEVLCQMIPGLQAWLVDSQSGENVLHIAELVCICLISHISQLILDSFLLKDTERCIQCES